MIEVCDTTLVRLPRWLLPRAGLAPLERRAGLAPLDRRAGLLKRRVGLMEWRAGLLLAVEPRWRRPMTLRRRQQDSRL